MKSGRVVCSRCLRHHSRRNGILGDAMKRTKQLLIVLTLNIVWGSCWVGSANAGVITVGTWTATDPSAAAIWDTSWDDPGLSEFFPDATSLTSWKEARGVWVVPDDLLQFNTHGNGYNSLTTLDQYALFRYVGPTQTFYFLGVDDMPSGMSSDHRYSDHIGHAYEQLPPVPTPEPGTLALLLCGGLVAFRKARSLRS